MGFGKIERRRPAPVKPEKKWTLSLHSRHWVLCFYTGSSIMVEPRSDLETYSPPLTLVGHHIAANRADCSYRLVIHVALASIDAVTQTGSRSKGNA